MLFKPAPAWEETEVMKTEKFTIKYVGEERKPGIFYRKTDREACLAHVENIQRAMNVSAATLPLESLYETRSSLVICFQPAVLVAERMHSAEVERVSLEELSGVLEELLEALKQFHGAKLDGLSFDSLVLKEMDSPFVRLMDFSGLGESTLKRRAEDVRRLGCFLCEFTLGDRSVSEADIKRLCAERFASGGDGLAGLLSATLCAAPVSAVRLYENFQNRWKGKMLDPPANKSFGPSELSKKASVEEPRFESSPGKKGSLRTTQFDFGERTSPGRLDTPIQVVSGDSRRCFRRLQFAVEWLRLGEQSSAARQIQSFFRDLSAEGLPCTVKVSRKPLSCNACLRTLNRSALLRTVCLHFICTNCIKAVISQREPHVCRCGKQTELMKGEEKSLPPAHLQQYLEYEWRLS